MMSVTMSADAEGTPLDVLAKLIEKRSAALKETASKSVIATGINILTSLKADTKKAPRKGNEKMYTLERTSLVAGWRRKGGVFHRVAMSGGHADENVTRHCRNYAGKHFVKGENVSVYKIQLFNENLNNTLYYCFAKSEKMARKYAEKEILARLLKKESGMARYAIGIAQAKASDKPMSAGGPSGSKAMRTAFDAAILNIDSSGWDSGKVSFAFKDDLRYSTKALRSGDSGLDAAIMKAANKTAGMIHVAFVNKKFTEDARAPFPEVKRK